MENPSGKKDRPGHKGFLDGPPGIDAVGKKIFCKEVT